MTSNSFGNQVLEQSAALGSPGTIFASILIPTYRRPNLVCRALENCIREINAAGEKIEVVVVDNCPDRSAEAAIKQRFDANSYPVRYIHEPRKGYSSVRNCLLQNACGRFVIFLDDDQYPEEGWLSAFLRSVKSGAVAAFGPIKPEYDVAPTNHKAILDKIFTRQFNLSDGADISGFSTRLSTGNCMFEKARCFPDGPAFDMRLNKRGGEDVWMFQGLLARSVPLTWVAEARAIESVPTSRITFWWLVRRRFESGQTRSLLVLHPSRRRPVLLPFWMAVGATQVVAYVGLYLIAALFRRNVAKDFLIKAAGGAGKVFWLGAWIKFVQASKEEAI
jgi:succinoglycan biosynthesis protein ExoM